MKIEKGSYYVCKPFGQLNIFLKCNIHKKSINFNAFDKILLNILSIQSKVCKKVYPYVSLAGGIFRNLGKQTSAAQLPLTFQISFYIIELVSQSHDLRRNENNVHTIYYICFIK